VRLGSHALAPDTVIHHLILRPPYIYATVSACGGDPPSNDLVAVDISDPSAPVETSKQTVAGYPRDLVSSAGHLYLGLAGAVPGIVVFDLSDPAHPEQKTRLLGEKRVTDLAVADGVLYALVSDETVRLYRDAELPVRVLAGNTLFLPLVTVGRLLCP
jgi:hypothetical protein